MTDLNPRSIAYLSLNSPFGPITLFEENGALIALDLGRVPDPQPTPLLIEAKGQLDAYFDKKLTDFDLPCAPHGTEFQIKVWRLMQAIPAGSVRTYGDLAHDLGSAARAVGGACGKNPIAIIIPCHRVMGAKNHLTGYSGFDGVETKKYLLRLEGYAPAQAQLL